MIVPRPTKEKHDRQKLVYLVITLSLCKLRLRRREVGDSQGRAVRNESRPYLVLAGRCSENAELVFVFDRLDTPFLRITEVRLG